MKLLLKVASSHAWEFAVGYWQETFTDLPRWPLHMITFLYNTAKEQPLPQEIQQKPI